MMTKHMRYLKKYEELSKAPLKVMLDYQVQLFMTKECRNIKASHHMHIDIDVKVE